MQDVNGDGLDDLIVGAPFADPNGSESGQAYVVFSTGGPADIGLSIHPHPTLSETFNFAAEMVEGTITDLYVPKKKPRKT